VITFVIIFYALLMTGVLIYAIGDGLPADNPSKNILELSGTIFSFIACGIAALGFIFLFLKLRGYSGDDSTAQKVINTG